MPHHPAKKLQNHSRKLNVGADYTDEEVAFLIAVDRYKRQHARPHPTWREVLALLRSLGYRRVESPGPLPSPEDCLP